VLTRMWSTEDVVCWERHNFEMTNLPGTTVSIGEQTEKDARRRRQMNLIQKVYVTRNENPPESHLDLQQEYNVP